MKQITLIHIITAITLPTIAFAQQRNNGDSTIPNQTITIIQNYKPVVAKPEKPEWQPVLHISDAPTPSFSYEVPQQSLSYSYHSLPINPLALGRRIEVLPFQNYIKLGLGNHRSIYLDGGAALNDNDNYEAQIHAHYLAQKGKIDNQQNSNLAIDANGKYYLANYTLYGGVNISKNNLYYYGYDHNSYNPSASSIKQSYFGLAANVGLENTTGNKWNITYHPEIKISLYSDKYKAVEKGLHINLPIQWQYQTSLKVLLGFKGDFVAFKNSNGTTGNNIFQINPAIEYSFKNFDIHAGISPTFGRDNQNYLLPDIHLRLHTTNDKYALIAGWKGDLIQNTFQQFTTKNPFLYNIYNTKQTQYQQVFAGFNSAFGNHLSVNATINWRQWNNLPLFVNDYLNSTDGSRFNIVYDTKVQAIALEANAKYQIAEKITLGVEGNWANFYKLTNNDKAWMEPMLRLSGHFDWQILMPLHFHARFDFWDGMYSLRADKSIHKLPAIFDLSTDAEYNITRRISVFAQINNILGQQYERWNQYPVYGFNFIGGLRVKF